MKKGFTLVETLVAVFILTLGIVAASTVTQRNLQGAYYSRDQITAYFLAEEAVEVLRNKRDSNIKQGSDWLFGMQVPSANNTSIDVCIETTDGIPAMLLSCPGDYLNYSDAAGYGYSAGDESKYKRRIVLTRRSTDEVEIKVTIEWSNGAASNKSFTIYKSLFNR